MKIRIFLLAILVFAASACTRRVDPRFVSVEIDTLMRRNPTLAIDVSYRFASIANAKEDPSLQAIEEANIARFFELEEFSGTAREAADSALVQLAADFLTSDWTDDPRTSVTYQWSVESLAQPVADTLLSYGIWRQSYTGGAHGMSTVDYHTYSLAGGYELTTSDLFDDSQREAVRRAIFEKLFAEWQVRDEAGLEENGFFPSEIDLTENFCITADGGVAFRYNPYEIACYATGPVEVIFSREELRRLRQK